MKTVCVPMPDTAGMRKIMQKVAGLRDYRKVPVYSIYAYALVKLAAEMAVMDKKELQAEADEAVKLFYEFAGDQFRKELEQDDLTPTNSSKVEPEPVKAL